MIKAKAYGITDIGKKRMENQDSILINQDIGLYAVADGMGGHKGGSTASQTALKHLESYIKENINNKNVLPEVLLEEGIQEANHQVYLKSQDSNEDLSGMGTTIVTAIIKNGKIYIGNVGDSRLYLFRDSQLWRITEDHSVLNEQIKRGLIDESQASALTESNIITRSVGFLPEVEVDTFQKDLMPDDLFILCSDGLTEMMSDEEICKGCESYDSKSLSDHLLKQSLEAGGNDNISIVVIAP